MSKQLESIAFFSCLREAIKLSIDTMEDISEAEKQSLSSFVLNEASDYEIMHFSVFSKFPSEKYNNVMEESLVEYIKDMLYENYFELSEFLTEKGIDSLVESLVPLDNYGLSSSKSILEHLSNTGLLKELISESERSRSVEKQLAQKRANARAGEIVSGDRDARLRAADEKSRADQGAVEDDKVDIGTEIATRGRMALHNAQTSASSAYNKAKEKVTNFLDNNKMAQSASDAGKRAADFVRNNAKPLGATVIAAALLYGGYKTFKRFLSKAARACSNQSGAAKTACMEKFKANAIKAQIADLRKSLNSCKNANNPQKCQATIQAKIQKLQAKL